MSSNVVILTDGGDLGRALVHAIRAKFADVTVMVEPPVSRRHLLRNRVRRLGYRRVLGQIVFAGLIVPLLARMSRGRIERIVKEYRLDLGPLPNSVFRFASVNAPECQRMLEVMQPKVVVLAGTRLLDKVTLSYLAGADLFNVHVGITPSYRGVHGAYWALREGRPNLAGATVHRVDPGIDTGPVVAHCRIEVVGDDTFVTYPYLQVAAAIPALLSVIDDALNGRTIAALDTTGMESRLYTHPTVFQYLSGLRRTR